jgi:hypothetical protein
VGEGKMRWLFWELYTARLYTQYGYYEQNRYPQALAIRYNRAISKKDLIDTTLDEWQRLDIQWKKDWPKQLDRIWPSVNKGDELILDVNQAGISRFYYNGKKIGEITDPAFGGVFLNIWLDPNTRAPELRKQLIQGN